jgi:hypothetical protein
VALTKQLEAFADPRGRGYTPANGAKAIRKKKYVVSKKKM